MQRLKEMDSEGRTIREIKQEVRRWVDREGVVVQIGDGRAVTGKLKTDWWLRVKDMKDRVKETGHDRRRWEREDGRGCLVLETKLRKRQEMAEIRQQRVVSTDSEGVHVGQQGVPWEGLAGFPNSTEQGRGIVQEDRWKGRNSGAGIQE